MPETRIYGNNETTVTREKDQDRVKHRLETTNTLVLAIATLSITWCSYQSTLWNGIQTFRLARANGYGRLAQEKAITVGQRSEIDAMVIIDFVNDVYTNRMDRINFYLRRLRPELASVMEKWMRSDPFHDSTVAPHPMATKEYRELIEREMAESKILTKKGQEFSDAAERANTVSDNYALYSVAFSMVMFLGAITTRLTQQKLSSVLILISGLVCMTILISLFYSMPLARKE